MLIYCPRSRLRVYLKNNPGLDMSLNKFMSLMMNNKTLVFLVVILCFAIATQQVSAYDEVNKTYYPVLTPPSHVYRVVTYDDGLGNRIADMTNQIGDVSSADTFGFDIYIVSSDEPATDTKIQFDFYEDPFYSGVGRYQFDLGTNPTGQWLHFSLPVSSISTYDGMDWSKGGILQVKSISGSFDIWLDDVGFYNATVLFRIMIDGDSDSWGHNFATAPIQDIPPTANNGNATHLVYAGGTGQFGNVANNSRYSRQMILLESLQGLMLKNANTEGIHIETWTDYKNNFNQIVNKRSVTYDYVSSPNDIWWLIDHFKNDFSGQYVLFDLENNPESLMAARMAAYIHDAVIVDVQLQSQAIANGLTMAIDVSAYGNQWIYDNWWPTWHRRDIAIDSAATGHYVAMLNEYATATGAVCFREDGATALRFAFLDDLDDDSPVLGWPEESYGELYSTLDNSLHNTYWAAINSVHNTAFYSSFTEPDNWPLQQQVDSDIVTTENTHYVCFVWSDGDNMGWHNAGYCWNTNWWASPYRGMTSIGWTLSPSMRDMGQVNIEYRYESAANTPDAKDNFIAVGSPGYSYPSFYSSATLAKSAARLAGYMEDLDLSTVLVLDRDAFEAPEVYMPYMSEPQIEAMFYWDVWGNYAKYLGDIKWVNNKPIISNYIQLRNDNTADVVADINARPADPHSEQGYSMIGVGAWSTTVQDIVTCSLSFDSEVKIVTPDEFVKLIKQNLAPPLLDSAYEIDTGDSQLGNYGTPSDPSFTITINSTQQQIDGTPSTKFQVGSTYAFSNMSFSPIDISNCQSFDVDIHGDASGTIIRLELYSSAFSSIIYKDLAIDFSGWRSFSWNLDGAENGMLEHPAGTRANTLSSVDIFQPSGPWNSTPGTFYIDNAVITVRSPYDLNGDGSIDSLDLAEFCRLWLTASATADFDESGLVDLGDWADFASHWLSE
jgi:hypothetical protein